MNKPSYTSRDYFAILAFASLGVVFAAALVTFNWWLLDRYKLGAGADILPAWNGSRAFLFENVEPYSRSVAERTQVEVYGRLAQEGEYPFALDIPFPLLILFFPLASIPDPIWARALWMFLSELALLALVTLAFRLTDWRPKRGYILLALGFALLWYYPVIALLDGSLSILLTLSLLGALILFHSGNDEAAGILLAIASMRWESTLILWLFIVISVYLARRWRVFAGFAMTWITLGGIAFLLYPNWLWPAFLRAVAANLRVDLLSPAWFFSVWFPASGAWIARGLAAFLVILLLVEWIGVWRSDNPRRLAWVVALTLAVAPLLGFSTTLANLAPLVFSFAVILPFVWERWDKRPALAILLFTLVFFAFPLLLRWQLTAAPFLADGLLFLLPPALTLLGLYWVRWYVVRPPRTWLDGVKRELRK
jgi:hypothetical protein